MIQNVILVAGACLGTLNLRRLWTTGATRSGKIERAVGPIGYAGLLLAGAAMLAVGLLAEINVDLFNEDTCSLLGKAGAVLLLILYADEFFNGDDPPKRRRRAKIKKVFAKLAPVR